MFCGFHLCRITGAKSFSQCYLFLYLPFNTEEERVWHRARGKYYKTDLLASFCLLPMLFSFSPSLHNGKRLFRQVKRPDLNFLCVSSVTGNERVWNLQELNILPPHPLLTSTMKRAFKNFGSQNRQEWRLEKRQKRFFLPSWGRKNNYALTPVVLNSIFKQILRNNVNQDMKLRWFQEMGIPYGLFIVNNKK